MRHLSYANVVATLALVIAVGTGGAWAANKLITGKQIKNGSLTGQDIKKGSVGSDRLKAGDVAKLRGTAGPAGAAGAAGANGVNGAPGTNGTNAITEMKIISNAVTSSADKIATATCPPGYLATGGSANTELDPNKFAIYTYFVGSDGNPATGYTASAQEISAVAVPWTLNVAVNCAKLSG